MGREEVIHKIPLRIIDGQIIELPKASHLLTVQMQGTKLCLWYKFPTANLNTKEKVEIIIAGTGHKTDLLSAERESALKKFQAGDNSAPKTVREAASYFTTIQQSGGMLVWHIFYRRLPDGL